MDFFEQIVINFLTDTYTLIVGFVAIGIPLALQIAVNASEKYDNALVTKRLTTGWIINPVTLIMLSTAYITLSLALKVAFPAHYISEHLTEIRSILGGIFLTIIIGVGYFYIRFYYRVLQSTDKYIRDFLFSKSLWGKTIYWLNDNLPWSGLSKIIAEIESKKIQQSAFKRIVAGLELLIDQLEKKSWEKGYIDILFEFHEKIDKAYLKQYEKPTPKLYLSDILLIETYWNALIRIIKLSRINQDTSLSFHSQRLLSSLITNLIHHPQYQEITSNDFKVTSENKINWSNDLYEIARWQSQQDSKGIDLILECEWARNICGVLEEPDYRYSKLGTIEAFKTYIDILELVAQKHPDKILIVYKNFSEGIPSFYGYDHYRPDWDLSTDWINDFWFNFDSKFFSFGGADNISEELSSLENGQAYLKHANYGVSRPLSEEEVNSEFKRVNYEEIYKKAYLDYCGLIALRFVAILAYFQRWDELKCSLEWAKPRGSRVNHLGGVLLSNSFTEIEQLIDTKFEIIKHNHWFFERHDILPFVLRGLLFQLVFYYEKTGESYQFFTNVKVEESKKKIEILELLINQHQYLENCKVFEASLVNSTVDCLKESLENLTRRSKALIGNCKLSVSRWEHLKAAMEKGWQTELKTDSLKQSFITMLNLTYTDKVCPVEVQLLTRQYDKEYFIDGLMYIGNDDVVGKAAFYNMAYPIYKELFRIAVHRPKVEKDQISNALIIASDEKLMEMGLCKPENVRQMWYHPDKNWKGVCVTDSSYSEHGVFIDINNVQLLCTKHLISEKYTHPLFSYYHDKGDGKVLVNVSAYIEVNQLKDGACIFI